MHVALQLAWLKTQFAVCNDDPRRVQAREQGERAGDRDFAPKKGSRQSSFRCTRGQGPLGGQLLYSGGGKGSGLSSHWFRAEAEAGKREVRIGLPLAFSFALSQSSSLCIFITLSMRVCVCACG